MVLFKVTDFLKNKQVIEMIVNGKFQVDNFPIVSCDVGMECKEYMQKDNTRVQASTHKGDLFTKLF